MVVTGIECPNGCAGHNFIRKGMYNNRLRLMCKDCGKTFLVDPEYWEECINSIIEEANTDYEDEVTRNQTQAGCGCEEASNTPEYKLFSEDGNELFKLGGGHFVSVEQMQQFCDQMELHLEHVSNDGNLIIYKAVNTNNHSKG